MTQDTESQVARAGYFVFSDYFFVDEGILRIRIVRRITLVTLIASFSCFFVVVGSAAGDGVLVGLPLLAASIVMVQVTAWIKRKALSEFTPTQLRKRSNKLIAWEDVKSVEQKSWRRLAVSTSGKSYHMSASKKDLDRVMEIINSKIIRNA